MAYIRGEARRQFHYDEETETFRCPAGQTLTRKQLSRKDRAVYYASKPEVCAPTVPAARTKRSAD